MKNITFPLSRIFFVSGLGFIIWVSVWPVFCLKIWL